MWATSVRAEPDLKPFFDLAIGASANPEAFEFLQQAERPDHQLLRENFYPPGTRSLEQFRARPFWDSYKRATRIFGAMGEVYLNHYMRKWIQAHPEKGFIHSAAYDRKNPDGTRPDGLVVRVAGDRLVVEKILESKMGDSPYQPAQVYGFARVWQLTGLTLPDGRHFTPEQIEIASEGKTVPLAGLNLKESTKDFKILERAMMLFVSQPKQELFAGETIATPFKTSDLLQLANRVTALGYLGVDKGVEAADELIGKQNKPPKYRVRQKKFREPVILRRPLAGEKSSGSDAFGFRRGHGEKPTGGANGGQ